MLQVGSGKYAEGGRQWGVKKKEFTAETRRTRRGIGERLTTEGTEGTEGKRVGGRQ